MQLETIQQQTDLIKQQMEEIAQLKQNSSNNHIADITQHADYVKLLKELDASVGQVSALQQEMLASNKLVDKLKTEIDELNEDNEMNL